MAHFEVMLVQGIRSFGPNAEDTGQIKFFRPLTLIMGQNGCGKTTLIESLKYVCTGEMPPGSGRGQSFVHDPNMAGDISVKAQVKLKFCNVRGQRMVAQRVIEASQKTKQLSVKTLDSTLTRQTATGEFVSTNKKCSDMDVELMSALGVTKPILNHVIFCHQEDSNWPLDEGKKLKERFDAIFDATEYLNCIKKMRDRCKVLRTEEGRKKTEAAAAQKDFAEAERLRREISAEQTSLAASERSVEECREELERVQARRSELNSLRSRASDVEVQKQQASTRLEEAENTCSELLDTIDQEHRLLTEQQLQMELAELDSCDQLPQQAAAELEQLESVQRQLTATAEQENKLSVRRGKLEAELERQNQVRNERDELVRELVRSSGEPPDTLPQLPSTGALSERQVRTATECLKRCVSQAVERQSRVLAEQVAQERRAQDVLDAARHRHTQLDTDLENRRRQQNTVREEIADKQRLLSEARGSGREISRLQSELTSVEADQQRLTSQADADQVSEQIQSEERTLSQLESDQQRLQTDKERLLSCLAHRKELDIHEKALRQQRTQIDELLSANSDNFSTIGVSSPSVKSTKPLSEQVTSRCSQLQIDVNRKEAGRKRTQNALSVAEVNVRRAREHLARSEQQLAKERGELRAALCEHGDGSGSEELEAVLALAESRAREQEEKHARLMASSRLYTDYIQQLRGGGGGGRRRGAGRLPADTCCPLCRRGFDSPTAASDLCSDLSRQLDQIPEQLAEAASLREQMCERRDQLLLLRPLHERVQRLLDGELAEARAAVSEAERVHTAAVEESDSKQSALELAESKLRCAHTVRDHVVVRLEERRVECSRLERECSRVQRHLSACGVNTDRDVATIDAELAGVRESIGSARDRLTRLRQHRDQLTAVADRLLQLRSRRLQLQQVAADEKQLVERCAALKSESETLRADIGRLQCEAEAARDGVEDEVRKRDLVVEERRRQEDEARSLVDAAKASVGRLESSQQRLSDVIGDGQTSRLLAELRQRVQELGAEQEEMRTRETALRQAVERSQENERSRQLRRRKLLDCQQLLSRRLQVDQLKREVASCEEQLSSMQLSAVSSESAQLERRGSRLQQKLYSEQGGQSRMRGVLAERRAKLAAPQFSDAHTVFRRCQIEHVLLRLAERDLATYARALDDALIGFHTERMRQINAIVRELWRECYGGNDIDHIRLCTDACSEGSTSITGRARTTYNYRVVMSKNGVEMDMRGRCSAGQKVLASLIIRMALAETFGSNCGMLTLDEPTTNLDHENVLRLADALAAIVSKRAVQANFQLVIITHDPAFLNVLSQSEHLESYYEVLRSEQGLSRLHRRDTI